MSDAKTRVPAAGELVAERFEIRSSLAVGSFGVVYDALDRETNQRVAHKTLNDKFAQDREQVLRLQREAWICSQLSHPNTVGYVDHGMYKPSTGSGRTRPWVALELVRGLSLEALLDARLNLPLGEAVHVIVSVLGSLEEAHHHGIVHRDLKPGNIIVAAPQATWRRPEAEGSLSRCLGIPEIDQPLWSDVSLLTVKLVDFGLGKLLETDNREVRALTGVGMAAGTVQYMSPEQVTGDKGIDHRADLYAAGALLYRLLVGVPPFVGATMVAVAQQQMHAPLPRLPEPLSQHPVDAVIAKAGEKKKRNRFTTAGEMAWALRCAIDPALAHQDPPEFLEPAAKKRAGLIGRLFGRS